MKLYYPRTPDTVKVGDLVRSFDFPGQVDHYMVGEVTEVGEFSYRIQRTQVVSNGVRKCDSACNPVIITAPKNGTEGFFGPSCGVQVISSPVYAD